MAITRASFGRWSDQVLGACGELILPVGDDHEIHPAIEGGRWSVVNYRTGEVASIHDDIDDAVAAAERSEEPARCCRNAYCLS